MTIIFPALVYLLCFATSTACSYLLARSYQRSRSRVLLWSALCFAFLGVNNFVVVLDLLIIPDIDFRILRSCLALAAVGVLLFGFIWDLED